MRATRRAIAEAAQAVDGASSDAAPTVVIDDIVYEFPGCREVPIGRDEIADYEGRYEFWNADTETALMVCEPTSPYHERSSIRLARMTDRIAAASGIDIEVLGTSDLLLRDSAGNRHRIMQADQIIYTRPIMSRSLGHAIEIAADEIPDVVLEVDLTTDVRRGKLMLYESWGFPEVWVEVPDERAPSRPSREPGVTLYVLGEDGYHEVESSVAFPTWTGAEIHAGMNEHRAAKPISDATAAVLRRVGRLLGQAAGSGPDNDPFLRAEREESREEGRVEGRAEGRIEGRVEGRMEGRVETLWEVLSDVFAARAIPLSPGFKALLAANADAPINALLDAARTCRNEDDFWRRLTRH